MIRFKLPPTFLKMEPSKKGKKHKYNAQQTIFEGIKFPSKGEAEKWAELRILEKGRAIKNLKRQVPYEIKVNGVLICKYVADFVYEEAGKKIVEDKKGYQTPEYKLKKKLMAAVHGIEIRES